MTREATVRRETKETKIEVVLRLEGGGGVDVATGIGMLDHMIEQLARHGGFDLTVHADGDLHVDAHHTVEDIGLALGKALNEALGDRGGIARMADRSVPLDEALVHAALDLSGRPSHRHRAALQRRDGGRAADRPGVALLRVVRAGRGASPCTCASWPGRNDHHHHGGGLQSDGAGPARRGGSDSRQGGPCRARRGRCRPRGGPFRGWDWTDLGACAPLRVFRPLRDGLGDAIARDHWRSWCVMGGQSGSLGCIAGQECAGVCTSVHVCARVGNVLSRPSDRDSRVSMSV